MQNTEFDTIHPIPGKMSLFITIHEKRVITVKIHDMIDTRVISPINTIPMVFTRYRKYTPDTGKIHRSDTYMICMIHIYDMNDTHT